MWVCACVCVWVSLTECVTKLGSTPTTGVTTAKNNSGFRIQEQHLSRMTDILKSLYSNKQTAKKQMEKPKKKKGIEREIIESKLERTECSNIEVKKKYWQWLKY